MEKPIRLFMAVPLPEAVKAALMAASTEMGRGLPNRAVRWVKPEQMHLTLRFLGDTAVSQLPALQVQMTQLAQQRPALTLRLNGMGAFPNRRKPRVVWAGLAGELVALQRLKRELDACLLDLGWPGEKRPFNPHITLGRVKNAASVRQINWSVDLANLEIEVKEIELIQSELRPSGAIYTVRHLAQLATSD